MARKRRKVSQSNSLRCSASLRVGEHFDRLSDQVQSPRLSASSLSALGIAAASFARRSDSGGEQRYSEKPDGGAGTPKERQQDSKTQRR